VFLTYRHRSGGDNWKDESYPVYLTTTPCHMGGERRLHVMGQLTVGLMER
jgi:hypothetical protein